MAVWPNGSRTIPTVTGEYGPRAPILTPEGWSGNFHYGIDIIWPDQIIRAPFAGRVIRAGYNGWSGLEVRIQAANGDVALLAHNSRIDVSAGQQVREGQAVAIMGTTGMSVGVHCHFEIHLASGGTINPRVYIANNPSGGSGGGGAKRKDNDMARNSGVYWKVGPAKDKTYSYANFNLESGFWASFGNGTGNGPMPSDYNNRLATALDTPSWAEITESHARVLEAACAAVRASK